MAALPSRKDEIKQEIADEDQLTNEPVLPRPFGASAQPIMFLGLETKGWPLGRVRIRLTCGPRRREQILRLCSLYKGTSFDHAYNVGKDGEETEIGFVNGFLFNFRGNAA